MPAAEHREALREMKELLRAAMAKLPEEYRVVYQKRDLEGLAGGGAVALAAMKSRQRRARELVREELDQALLGKNTCREEVGTGSGAGSESRTEGTQPWKLLLNIWEACNSRLQRGSITW